jgi:hypothetical protein
MKKVEMPQSLQPRVTNDHIAFLCECGVTLAWYPHQTVDGINTIECPGCLKKEDLAVYSVEPK